MRHFDYPVYLDLRGVPVLVVGAGPVAARKVAGLAAAGARVRVVAPSVSPALDRALVDEVRTIHDEPAFAMVRELARKEGLLVGGSSGAAAQAAREVARALPAGNTVVTVFADGFERYLGKGVFENL